MLLDVAGRRRRCRDSTRGGHLAEEVEQLVRNEHVTVRNPHCPESGSRRLLIGRTGGGRYLTLVIEQTVEPTTWLVITGWESTDVERKLGS
jgi:hypothetical protein